LVREPTIASPWLVKPKNLKLMFVSEM